MRFRVLVVALFAAACERAPVDERPIPVPAREVSHRFVVTPVTTTDDTLGLFLDTGGGINMLWASSAKRLKLEAKPFEIPAEGEDVPKGVWSTVPYPAFSAGRG